MNRVMMYSFLLCLSYLFSSSGRSPTKDSPLVTLSMQLQNLNEHFAIPTILSFEETEHGLIKGVITAPTCTGEFYLHGAHLTR